MFDKVLVSYQNNVFRIQIPNFFVPKMVEYLKLPFLGPKSTDLIKLPKISLTLHSHILILNLFHPTLLIQVRFFQIKNVSQSY